MIDYSPTRGKETPDDHPALIINQSEHISRTGIAIVVPMTSGDYRSVFSVEVLAEQNLGFSGFFHPGLVRAIDIAERNPRFLGRLPEDIFAEVLGILHDIVAPDPVRGAK
jgi:mRNA-degrading endonuclease toxin of MazEF toxin-antitoxin module